MLRAIILAVAIVLAAVIVSGRPPAKADQQSTMADEVVNFNQSRRYSNTGQTQEGMPPYELFKVPSDRVLFITDIQRSSAQPLNRLVIGCRNAAGERQMLSIDGSPGEYHSSVGLMFPPGSTVIDRSEWMSISFTGRLARP